MSLCFFYRLSLSVLFCYHASGKHMLAQAFLSKDICASCPRWLSSELSFCKGCVPLAKHVLREGCFLFWSQVGGTAVTPLEVGALNCFQRSWMCWECPVLGYLLKRVMRLDYDWLDDWLDCIRFNLNMFRPPLAWLLQPKPFWRSTWHRMFVAQIMSSLALHVKLMVHASVCCGPHMGTLSSIISRSWTWPRTPPFASHTKRCVLSSTSWMIPLDS